MPKGVLSGVLCSSTIAMTRVFCCKRAFAFDQPHGSRLLQLGFPGLNGLYKSRVVLCIFVRRQCQSRTSGGERRQFGQVENDTGTDLVPV